MPDLPLTGIRVVELCTGAAGPTVAKCLGEYGAEVLKIESRQRGDGHRGGTNPARWNVMPDFVKLSRNKKSVTVNLKTDRGKQVIKDLIAQSDVVVDNYSLGVLERWGMSYDELRALKPDVILIRLKGLGCTGPYAHHITYGPNLLTLSGITHLWNHPNSPASTGEARTQHPDFMSGIAGAAAVMSALLYRHRTGKGQCIDFGQIEAGAMLLGPYYLDYSINGRDAGPVGNAIAGAAPHDVYPCKGDDKWCVIAVRNQEEWQRFCQATGNSSWSSDERFANPLAREGNKQALDELVAGWTRDRDGNEIMRLLQSAGVPAAPVQDVESQITDNPQFDFRKLFITMDEPKLGPITAEAPPVKMSETPPRVYRVAPLMGEHTQSVLRDILHLPESEIKDLAEQGVLD